EATASRQMRKVRDRDRLPPDVAGQLPRLLVGPAEEVLQKSQLVHQLKGRRVNGIAAEVPQEGAVLLEDEHVHASAGEQEAQHHPSRAAARDAAADLNRLRRAPGVLSHEGAPSTLPAYSPPRAR